MVVPLPDTDPDDLQEISLTNGTYIVWGRMDVGKRRCPRWERVQSVIMHFTLAGVTTAYAGLLNRSIDIRANQHNLLYPAGGDFRLDSGTNQPGQFLQIHIAPDFFSQPSTQDGPTLQHLAELVQSRQPVCLASEPLPITPAMHTVLAQITKCPLTCSLKRLFLEAKVVELLALQLEQYEQQSTTAETDVPGPEYDKVVEARRLLETRFNNPPTLPELSRLVGLNEFKLKKQFKAVFGETIHGWVLHYRLNRAYQLLQRHELTISEVAWQVGYQHPAHFTTAFKKKFGITPSRLLTNTVSGGM